MSRQDEPCPECGSDTYLNYDPGPACDECGYFVYTEDRNPEWSEGLTYVIASTVLRAIDRLVDRVREKDHDD